MPINVNFKYMIHKYIAWYKFGQNRAIFLDAVATEIQPFLKTTVLSSE